MSEIYKIIKNLDSVTRKFGGVYIASGETYTIADLKGLEKAQGDQVLMIALLETTPEASMINPNSPDDELINTAGLKYLLNLDKPVNTDNRPIMHNTPRRLGTYTYITSSDDDSTDPHAVGGTSNVNWIKWNHQIGGNNPEVIYMDFNCINNITYIHEGSVSWAGALDDYLKLSIVPKLTTSSSGSNTNYDLYGGYLVVPNPYGTGTLTVNDADRVLVQMVENEFGNKPAGYFDATWNTSTKQFDNITPNYDGTGNYNMFTAEVALSHFINSKLMYGTSHDDIKTKDSSELGHGMRVKLDIYTIGDDHAWSGRGELKLFRTKTS